MSARQLAAVAVAVVASLVLCAAGVGSLFTGGAAPCTTTDPTSSGSGTAPSVSPGPDGRWPTIGQWSPEQVGNAATIVTVGARMGVPHRGWIIAVATAMQESGLRNLPGGDRDSVGLFQQRPSQGWGIPTQLQDAVYAATKFYQRLLEVAGWQTMPLTDAAQAVQRSAYPDAYAEWEPDAQQLAAALSGLTGALADCVVAVGPHGWVQPVQAPVVSGFRTDLRPGHDGVDLGALRGTRIVAASAGVVSRVRCNAIDAATGGDWGCDRDGHPTRVHGCGWYVDIGHPGGIVTRYCHMLARPLVSEGQTVAAGQVIGVVGSSGHSSGPHLHYQVHVGDHNPVDPVPFMAAHAAPLG